MEIVTVAGDPQSPARGTRPARPDRIIDVVDRPAQRLDLRARRGIARLPDLSSSLARQSVLVAAVCVLTDTAGFLLGAGSGPLHPRDWAVLLAVAAVDAALALPARSSGWVALAQAVVAFGSGALLAGSGLAGNGNEGGTLIAGDRAGAWLRGGTATVAVVVMASSLTASHLLFGSPDGAGGVVEIVRNALLPWLVGRYTTARRAYIAELEQRAETQRRDARAAVEYAVAEERSAIARDLHDVISHHVSAIGVHAGAARLGLTGAARSDGVAGSLSAVEMSSRAALLDLRRLLGLLHGDRDRADRQPGLDNIEELLDGVRRAGLPARLRTSGSPRPVPASLDIALYRIIQEMLTNALRHGDGGTVEIEVHHDTESVSVSARNGVGPGPAPAHDDRAAAARGLAGIRKRAAMFKGTVAHGPEPTGGTWCTTVTFPLGAEP